MFPLAPVATFILTLCFSPRESSQFILANTSSLLFSFTVYNNRPVSESASELVSSLNVAL